MIEVLVRDGLAREMRWTVGEHRLATPNILFLASKGIPHFARGEAFLAADAPVEGKFTLLSGGSWFRGERPAPSTLCVPPFPNIPSGLEAAPGEAYSAALASFRETGSPVLPVTGGLPA